MCVRSFRRESRKQHGFWLAGISKGILIGILLVACTPVQSTLELGSRNSSCWHKICPGATTRERALNTLQTVPEVDRTTIGDRQRVGHDSYLYWGFTADVVEDLGEIYYRDGVVTRIVMRTGKPLTLEMAVELFGRPDTFLVTSGCADTRWLWSGVFWSDLGIHISFFDYHLKPNETVELSPGQAAVEVEFFAPQLYEEVLRRSEGVSTDMQAEIPAHLNTWDGYGEVRYWDVCR